MRSHSRGLVAPPEPQCRWSPRPLMRKLAAHRRSLPDSGFFHGVFSPSFFSSFWVSLRPSFCLCHRPISIRRLQADQVLRSGCDKQIAAATKNYTWSLIGLEVFWGAAAAVFDIPLNDWKWHRRERCLFHAAWIGYGFIFEIFCLYVSTYKDDEVCILCSIVCRLALFKDLTERHQMRVFIATCLLFKSGSRRLILWKNRKFNLEYTEKRHVNWQITFKWSFL